MLTSMAKKMQMALRVADAWVSDQEKFTPETGEPPLEVLKRRSKPKDQITPKKTLLDSDNYEFPSNMPDGMLTQPLRGRRDYGGDQLMRMAEDLQDIDDPSTLLKYIPETQPRDLQDEFYEFTRPGDGKGYYTRNKTIEDYENRGWNDNESPEISEDHIIIQNQKCGRIIANFLVHFSPDLCLDCNDPDQIRTAKRIYDLQKAKIDTPKGGERDLAKAYVNLARADTKRWTYTFRTGKENYTTVIKLIPQGNVRDPNKLDVRCSCSCKSWIFWGAQFNAIMGDYLYGPVMPKFAPPQYRDPKHKFLVCKHVLACLDIVKHYILKPISTELKKTLKAPLKVDLTNLQDQGQPPQYLASQARNPVIKKILPRWLHMGPLEQETFIKNLQDPDAIAFMAHRFPKSATNPVIKKLKDMSLHEADFKDRQEAKKQLEIIT
jgi:hypothetical protein